MPVNGLMGLGGGGSRGSSGAGVTVEVKLWGAAGGSGIVIVRYVFS